VGGGILEIALSRFIKSVPHRHFIFSIPKILQQYFLYDDYIIAPDYTVEAYFQENSLMGRRVFFAQNSCKFTNLDKNCRVDNSIRNMYQYSNRRYTDKNICYILGSARYCYSSGYRIQFYIVAKFALKKRVLINALSIS